jgi:hypothetical protein
MQMMRTLFNRISLRLRLFLPLLIGIILAIALAAVFLTRISIRAMNYELEQSLALEVRTIIKMFERERDLKLDQASRTVLQGKSYLDRAYVGNDRSIE